jgi:hypothetical protein
MKGGKGNWTVLRKCGHLTQPQDLERYQRNEEWSVLHPTMQTVRAGELKDWDLSPGVQNPTAERSERFYNAPLVLNEGLGCRQHLRAVCRGQDCILLAARKPPHTVRFVRMSGCQFWCQLPFDNHAGCCETMREQTFWKGRKH